MKKEYKKYLEEDMNFDKITFLGIFALVIVIAGTFGWLYEFIFYYFNGGMKTFYWRGGNFLPWINIYATGSLMVFILTYKLRKKPLYIFLISAISCGILEYFSGLGMYIIGNGMRCWDYNNEILNFGNIDGFVCLRSVTIFGLFSLILIYGLIPLCCYIATHMKKKSFLILIFSLCFIILFDEFYNLIFARILHLPRATYIYRKLGVPFVKFK